MTKFEIIDYAHLLLDTERNLPVIAVSPGVVFGVDQLLAELQVLGCSPEEMQRLRKHPKLSLEMIYSAVAYYHDHPEVHAHVAYRKSMMFRRRHIDHETPVYPV